MLNKSLSFLFALTAIFLLTSCELDDKNACYMQCRDGGPKECSTSYDNNADCQEWGLELCGTIWEDYAFRMNCSGCDDSKCKPEWY